MKFCRKRKWTHNRLKRLRMHHVHPFSENFVGEVPGHLPQLQRDIPLRTHTAVSPRGWSLTPSGNGTTLLYIFNATFLKIQCTAKLSEFKRLYLYSILHHFAPFFQNFLGGGGAPPNPRQREGAPIPYPPPRPFGPPDPPSPRLSSGSAIECIYMYINAVFSSYCDTTVDLYIQAYELIKSV